MEHNILWSTDIQCPFYLWNLDGSASMHVFTGKRRVLRHEDIDFEHRGKVNNIKTAGASDSALHHLDIHVVVWQQKSRQRLSMLWPQCGDEISIQGGPRYAGDTAGDRSPHIIRHIQGDKSLHHGE